MNIALFASAFYPHVGGVEEMVRQLARELNARGHSAIVLTNRWPRDLPAHEIYEGTPLYRLAMRAPEGSLKAKLNYQLTHKGIESEMVAILKRHKIEVLHVQCVSANGHYARLASQVLGLPLVVTAHGERTMDATGIYERSAFLNATLRDLLANADFLTACSRDTLDDLERYSGQQFGPRARVVYNGIAAQEFGDPSIVPHRHERPFILGIGRLVPQKGFDVLLRAFAIAAKNASFGHDLLLAGEGSEREALAALIDELGLAGRAHLVGRAARPEAVGLFKGCSFFVLPSRHEPFGIVNLEAMAAGKPVVASRVGGVPEIVREGENGLLVPGGDAEALADVLSRMAGDAVLRERLGENGRALARGFTWPRITDQYQEVYEQVLQARGAPSST